MENKKSSLGIYLAGDSTVADCPPRQEPRAGWGQVLHLFFNKEVSIYNHSVGGRSSKSFIEEGRLKVILENIKSGDYLFIQFGHNDQKEDTRRTEPFGSYKFFLKQYIDGARKKGGNPVFITPVHRRTFDREGRIVNSLGDYPLAMIELAKRENIPYLDIWTRSKWLYELLGPEKSKSLFLWYRPGEQPNYPDGIKDDTHFSEKGAVKLAELIVEEIKEKIPNLKRFLN